MSTPNDNAIERHLRSLIAASRSGARLPSVRSLQHDFAASPVTIQRSLRVLASEGLVVTRPGDGTFVSGPRPPGEQDTGWQTVVLGRAAVVPGGLDHLTTMATPTTLLLDGGFPDPSLQAHDLLARFAARAAKQSESWDRCLPEGLATLRSIVAAELGDGFGADDVIITSGAQSAIGIVFRALMRPGDTVAIEDPSYPGAIAAATLAGLELAPVPTDAAGVRPDALASVLRRTGARVVFLQPRHSNPTGTTLDVDRRGEVLRAARDASAFIVEDDWVRDLDLGAPTPPPLCTRDETGHVIYLRSFSKVSAPGVRIAGLVARGPVAARLRTTRLFADFFAPPLMQSTVASLLASPEWPRHLRMMRAELVMRRDALIGALARRAPALAVSGGNGGVAVWIRLPEGCDERAFVAACAGRGVRVGAGRPFWLTDPAHGHVRVSFASASATDLGIAAARVGDALDDACGSSRPRQRARKAAR